jgi:diacylglycerol kinase (ATP)
MCRDMKRFLGAFTFAFMGICSALKTERNFRIHLVAMCLAVAAGFYLGLSAVEWCLVIFAIGLVLAAELFNTAIERLGDEAAAGKRIKTIGSIKDISAGAVLIAALTALVIGVIVLVIPLFEKLF